MTIICRRAVTAADLSRCLDIRETVFIGEQNVPAELERDGLEDQCLHYLAEVNGTAIGTARVMPLDGKFKFQRVAVLAAERGCGLGTELMDYIMEDLAKRDDAKGRTLFLSSQVSAISFYTRLGFEASSDEYEEAGIQHVDMAKAI